jgi:hypothetical protein
MAQLPQSGDKGFTLAGFLILAALGTFLWKGAPLESVRPSGEQSGWYERNFAQQVPARLWQDPFRAVYAHEQAVKAGAATADYVEDPRKEIKVITEEKPISGARSGLTLLMVLVSPGSYAELEERRRRRRYAVLSGLADEHFVPRDSEMLNVFYHSMKADGDGRCGIENKGVRQQTPALRCYPVPYEWYDYEGPSDRDTSGPRHVLVLWLNESRFVESPLTSIAGFLASLLPAGGTTNSIRATILGPARSDALRNLVTRTGTEKDEWLRCSSGLAEFNIFSSTATVADADLVGERKQKVSPLTALQHRLVEMDCGRFDGGVQPPAGKTNMRFFRTIRSDDVLIEKLAAELKENRSISPEKDYVVVISEWDTYFGRSLPRAFSKHFCAPDSDCKNENVLRYSYQRGIDGILAGNQNEPPPTKRVSLPKTDAVSPSVEAASVRRPSGTGQFDYLRRLAVDLRRKDRDLRLSTGHGVRAVVLLGSDVYDKLLILRALRPELPGAVFATTDLDANLLHPAEYSWTRNLIVASTFDLSLSPRVPMTTMPFRDSYQTSVYLAARLGFNQELMSAVEMGCDVSGGSNQEQCVQQHIYLKLPPQLMEVGRQTLVELSDGKQTDDSWNRVIAKSFALPVALGLFTITLLGILALHQMRPLAGRLIGVLALLLVLFSILSTAIFVYGAKGEPLTLVAGASTWPAEFIRIFAVVLTAAFIWLVIHRLHKNWNELGVRYFGIGSEAGADGITVKQLWESLAVRARHPIRTLKKFKCTQLLPAAMMVVLFLAMRIVLPEPLPLIEKIALLIGVWVALIGIWWAMLYGHVWKGLHVLSINRWVADCMPKDAVAMWRAYSEYGAGDQRFLRTIAYILIYFAFASILFAILGAPQSPCRGGLACGIDKAVLGVSVLSMLVLLFLVVDATRLCICWVDSLGEHKLDWNKSRMPEFVQRLRLPEKHATAWIQIHLIGERTAEMTRLIYYPVLIILLLLLARSTYFDNWDFPQALAIIIGLNFIIALGSVVRLNFVARSVRDEILWNLQEDHLAGDRAEAASYEPNASQRQELIRQLEELRIGAYLRVWDQPPVRATLLLLGGATLTYAEYLTIF